MSVDGPDAVIRSPRCPGCDGEPAATGMLPWLCTDPDCKVLYWGPHDDPARFKATAVSVVSGSYLAAPPT